MGSSRSTDAFRSVAGILLLLAAFLPARAAAQYVRIRVTDDLTEAPIPDALVTSLRDRAQWRVDSAGHVIFGVQHGGVNVFTVRRFGFAPVTTTLTVPEHDTLKVHVILHALGVALDTVNVTQKATVGFGFPRSQFDERRTRATGGQFITRADIELRQPFSSLDLFKQLHGVQVQQNSRFQTVITSTRGTQFLDQCVMSVGVDGLVMGLARQQGIQLRLPQRVLATETPDPQETPMPEFDVNDIPPNDIYGIEIYNGPATIPAQFVSMAGANTCGLIMIWTRNGPGQSRNP